MINGDRSRLEFMVLMAAMTAVEAFSIDAITPALGEISNDLSVAKDNYRQFVVTAFTLGFSLGLLVYGFFADHFGRRNPVLVSFLIYLVGTVTCIFSESFTILILGRIIQGIGGSGPYVISIAIVRDRYEGREMASMLSLIMMVFIGVPIVAPFIGQGILLWLGWRSIYTVMAIFAIATMLWFFFRQSETLADKDRILLSRASIMKTIRQVISCSQTMRYLIAMGMILGAFYAFLSTGQQIFQEIYALGNLFPAVYALLASVIGLSAYLNASWVKAIGGAILVHRALAAMMVVSALLILVSYYWDGSPPLLIYMAYLLAMMFGFGLLFGNVTSLGMEPMGELAGSASSLFASLSTFIAIAVATAIGAQLQDDALILVIGFFISCSVAWGLNYLELGKSQGRTPG